MELLEEKWNELRKRVILPLWNGKFKAMYENTKLNYDDFESLAGIELTRAMAKFNPEKSNLFTYATNVLQRKAKTELTFYHRERRVGNIDAVSINKLTDEDAQITLEDLLVDNEQGFEDSENNQIYKEVLRYLRSSKEKEIIFLSIQGYDDENIAKKVRVTTERIRNLRKRLADTSDIRRVLRKLGYSLGGIEL